MTPERMALDRTTLARMTLDRFYPIFEDSGWLSRMLPLGVKFVQLRIKDRPAEVVAREIRAGKRLCEAHGATLVVNDHWREAIDAGCGFVHLGQEDLDTADVGAIRGAGLQLGISTHDEAELDRALSLRPDYVALGPVYPTILKKMKWRPQGLARLAQWKQRIGDLPLVAIGGMTVERAEGAFAAGANVISVVTDITLSADPEGRAREWVGATR